MQPSADAPDSWTVADGESAMRSELQAADADVIALQEVPNPRRAPTVESHRALAATTESHAGLISTMVRTAMVASVQQQVLVCRGFAVMVAFDSGLTVANVHLAPFKSSADLRYAQLATIVDASPTEHLLIIGDTNMTAAEMGTIAALGLGAEKPPEFTINWRRNRFHPDGRGPRITTYYTRWLATEGVTVSDVKVWSDPVPVAGGRGFYLSDHFALSGRAEVASG